MAKPDGEGPQQNSRPEKNAASSVIQSVLRPGRSNGRMWPILILAWCVSFMVHVVLLSLFLFVTVSTSAANVSTEIEVIRTEVDDDKPVEDNLVNDEIGDDPSQLLNYDIKNIADVSVPGPLNPTEAIGIKDMAEATPANIPPPPGLILGSEGQSGGQKSKLEGLASPFGSPGGTGGIMVPGGFGGRAGATREVLLREGGGNTETEAAVASGLKWLTTHQAPDGHWSLDGFNQHGHCNCNGYGQSNDIAATAFGLLPLLGAGETHKNAKGIYSKNVDRALKYLMLKQAKDGYFGGGMYAHGLASIAMCEAYGMTSDPLLKGSAQRAIQFIRAAQSESGGWRYEPRQGGDTSVVGWQVMALKSGQMAGLEVDDSRNPTLAKATKWLNSCQTADGTQYGYTNPQEASPTMSAVGLLCRLYLGTGPKNSGIVGGVAKLKQSAPGTISSMYYYYYATQVMHHVGGDSWQQFWEPKMRQMLLAKQDKGTDPKRKHLKGSWTPARDAHGGAGGRVMITSLSILTLEVYYRHLPLYRRDLGGGKSLASN